MVDDLVCTILGVYWLSEISLIPHPTPVKCRHVTIQVLGPLPANVAKMSSAVGNG